jgi:hypothetical protein
VHEEERGGRRRHPCLHSRILSDTALSPVRTLSLTSPLPTLHRAHYNLGKAKGYSLVACDSAAVNAIFVRSDILECQGLTPPSLQEAYVWQGLQWQPAESDPSRKWIVLDDENNEVERKYIPSFEKPGDPEWVGKQ